MAFVMQYIHAKLNEDFKTHYSGFILLFGKAEDAQMSDGAQESTESVLYG